MITEKKFVDFTTTINAGSLREVYDLGRTTLSANGSTTTGISGGNGIYFSAVNAFLDGLTTGSPTGGYGSLIGNKVFLKGFSIKYTVFPVIAE